MKKHVYRYKAKQDLTWIEYGSREEIKEKYWIKYADELLFPEKDKKGDWIDEWTKEIDAINGSIDL